MPILKKTKEKPIIFGAGAIVLGALAIWGITGLFNSSDKIEQIEGVFVQQLDSYTGGCAAIPDEITFEDGFVYGSGAEAASMDKKYEYVIKDKDIYIIQNGQEVFSELTIQDKSTLVWGDGVFDEVYDGIVCGINADGIYKKQ